MTKLWLAAALAGTMLAAPAVADEFRFDFTGTVLTQTRPGPPSVTPQPITGYIRYTAPAGGNITTLMGDAFLSTSLYGDFAFTSYSAMLNADRFRFSGQQPNGQGFSLWTSALPGGGYGFVVPGDGFALTGEPVNATGRLSGRFADDGATAVPEPAAWLLMIGGVGLIGGALRQRRAPARVTATLRAG